MAPPSDGSVVSAVPADLIAYSKTTGEANDALAISARDLRVALEALRASRSEDVRGGGVLSVPDVDDRLEKYTADATSTDAWVGPIGQAFLAAGRDAFDDLSRRGKPIAPAEVRSTSWKIDAFLDQQDPNYERDLNRFNDLLADQADLRQLASLTYLESLPLNDMDRLRLHEQIREVEQRLAARHPEELSQLSELDESAWRTSSDSRSYLAEMWETEAGLLSRDSDELSAIVQRHPSWVASIPPTAGGARSPLSPEQAGLALAVISFNPDDWKKTTDAFNRWMEANRPAVSDLDNADYITWFQLRANLNGWMVLRPQVIAQEQELAKTKSDIEGWTQTGGNALLIVSMLSLAATLPEVASEAAAAGGGAKVGVEHAGAEGLFGGIAAGREASNRVQVYEWENGWLVAEQRQFNYAVVQDRVASGAIPKPPEWNSWSEEQRNSWIKAVSEKPWDRLNQGDALKLAHLLLDLDQRLAQNTGAPPPQDITVDATPLGGGELQAHFQPHLQSSPADEISAWLAKQ